LALDNHGNVFVNVLVASNESFCRYVEGKLLRDGLRTCPDGWYNKKAGEGGLLYIVNPKGLKHKSAKFNMTIKEARVVESCDDVLEYVKKAIALG
jgi:hypothetical protein